MSFIKQSPISYEETIVLQFALQRILPHFKSVLEDAKDERKIRAENNVHLAEEMLKDLTESLKPLPK